MNNEAMSEGLVTVAKGSVYTGAATAVTFGGLSISEWVAIGGLLVALGGFAMQVYYQRKRDKREQAEFEKKHSASSGRVLHHGDEASGN